jgi:hypothetical protein
MRMLAAFLLAGSLTARRLPSNGDPFELENRRSGAYPKLAKSEALNDDPAFDRRRKRDDR